jgi:hypothetical protein
LATLVDLAAAAFFAGAALAAGALAVVVLVVFLVAIFLLLKSVLLPYRKKTHAYYSVSQLNVKHFNFIDTF